MADLEQILKGEPVSFGQGADKNGGKKERLNAKHFVLLKPRDPCRRCALRFREW